MSRKQSGKPVRGNRKSDLERKRDERAARRALAKDRKNRPPEEEANEFFSFTNQLQALGLKLREVPGDGNCLFRALGDQLEGHSRGHLRLRQDTVQHMQAHRQDFEPFVEDDVPFTQHCTRVRGGRMPGYKPLVIDAVTVTFGLHNLSQPGTFAGNDAIVAFARSHQLRVVIHQLNTPLWEIDGSDKPMCRELHIAYRYGDHYDSVRRIGDNSENPAHLYIENLNRCRGRGETGHSGGGPRGQHNGPSLPPLEDDEHLILSCLNTHGCSPALNCPAEWIESDAPCPGPWQEPAAEQVPATTAERGIDKSGRNASQKPKISNKQRKEQQRLEKKKRQEDRHRQKVLQSRSPQDQNLNSAEPITLVPALNTLSI